MGSFTPFASFARVQKPRLIETITWPGSAIPSRIKLPLVGVYQALLLRLSGTVTVAGGAADGTLTAEQPLSFIRNVRLEAASSIRPQVGEIKNADFPALYRMAQFWQEAPAELTVLAIPGLQAATPIAASVYLPFELLHSVNPRATLLNAREFSSLDLVVEWGAATDLITGGDRTVTPAATLSVYGIEFLDSQSYVGPYGIHRCSFIEQPIAAANSRLVVDLKRGYVLRSLLLKQFTQTTTFHTPVETIINSARIEVNREPRFDTLPFAVIKAWNAMIYKAQPAAVPVGYAFLDLMNEGQVDTLIDTTDFEAVSVVLDVSAPANARIRVYPIEVIAAR